MERMAQVVHTQFPAGRRVLAISDIHGNLPFLRGLLAKAGYTSEDILVLVGDLIEKGPDSLGLLRYVMELSRQGTVYCLRGNCDSLVCDFLFGRWQPLTDFYRIYAGKWGEHFLPVQMGREIGFPYTGVEDLPALEAAIRPHFAAESAFLEAMPEILLTPDYLFVHGGVDDEVHLEGLPSWKCLKNDDFLGQNHTFRRWCVVGHWPVTLYHPHIPCAAPLLVQERHIASIDGGCCLKADGQLNALVLPPAPGGEFTWFSYDGLPVAVALDAQDEMADAVNIRWGRSRLEVLGRGEELCLCRHMESGRVLEVLTDYLQEGPEGTFCEDSTDYRPPVAPGERLGVVKVLSDRALVKRKGATGWYLGRLAPFCPEMPE